MFPISRVDFKVKVVSPPKPQSLDSSVPPPSEDMKDKFKDNQLAQITVICASVISLAIIASIMTCIWKKNILGESPLKKTTECNAAEETLHISQMHFNLSHYNKI
ncbi:hypothetical protein XENTR_v10006270 [Xenopus tropicalis]|nr:hypothetical protein XENTR_v10006270 [Xenopus tropicalis]